MIRLAELLAKDIMNKKVITLRKTDSVKDAAKVLSENKIGGAPVVDEEGKLIGIISEGDLILQDVKLHFPTYLHFLDGFIYLGSLKRFESLLKKAVASRVEDLMSTSVITVSPEESLEDVATLMVDKNLSRIPVVAERKVVGIITKGDIVRTLARS